MRGDIRGWWGGWFLPGVVLVAALIVIGLCGAGGAYGKSDPPVHTGRVQFRVQGTTLRITNTKDRITTHLDLVGTARRNGQVVGRRSWRRATIGPNSTRSFTLRLRGPGICSDWDISGFMFQSSCN